MFLCFIQYTLYIMDMAKDDDDLKTQNKVSVSATVKPSIVERLDEYCKNNGYIRARVIEKSIVEYLDREEKKKK